MIVTQDAGGDLDEPRILSWFRRLRCASISHRPSDREHRPAPVLGLAVATPSLGRQLAPYLYKGLISAPDP